jgi:AraC-like DNA-binding protein
MKQGPQSGRGRDDAATGPTAARLQLRGHARILVIPLARRFQESAMSHLYSWGSGALYVGPAFGLSAHRNAVAVLALGLDAPFEVANDPAEPAKGYRRCRSVLIPPNTLHHLASTRGNMAFLYLDPHGPELRQLAGKARAPQRLVRCLRDLAAGRSDWTAVRRHLHETLHNGPAPPVDPRIARSVAMLRKHASKRLSLSELARATGLSESRFRHLFKATIGLPLRRYRLWLAMDVAMRRVASTGNLTVAALDAGFASSAHFSATFRDMFGLEPSRLAKLARSRRDA